MPEWLLATLLIGGFFLSVGLLLFMLSKKDTKRSKAIRSIGIAKGFIIAEEVESRIIKEKFKALPVFNIGNQAMTENFMHGKMDGFDVTICDYMYWTTNTMLSGRKSTVSDKIRETLICIDLPGISIPSFDITIRSSIAMFTAYNKNITVECSADLEFVTKYIVCPAPGSDHGIIKKLITQEVQSTLGKLKHLKLEAGGNQMMLTKTRQPINPRDLEQYLNSAVQVAQLFMSKIK